MDDRVSTMTVVGPVLGPDELVVGDWSIPGHEFYLSEQPIPGWSPI